MKSVIIAALALVLLSTAAHAASNYNIYLVSKNVEASQNAGAATVLGQLYDEYVATGSLPQAAGIGQDNRMPYGFLHNTVMYVNENTYDVGGIQVHVFSGWTQNAIAVAKPADWHQIAAALSARYASVAVPGGTAFPASFGTSLLGVDAPTAPVATAWQASYQPTVAAQPVAGSLPLTTSFGAQPVVPAWTGCTYYAPIGGQNQNTGGWTNFLGAVLNYLGTQTYSPAPRTLNI